MNISIRHASVHAVLSALAVAVLFPAALSPAAAQDATVTAIPAPAEPGAILLGTGPVKGATAPESWFRQYGVPMARNVSTATLTPVLPAPGKANGTAVIVAPGGAFLLLSMENEGWRVARALADRGITAFVLKYRLRPTPLALADFDRQLRAAFANVGRAETRSSPDEAVAGLPEQIADAVAAITLVRARSAEWGIDPKRVGMMGFSAGAMTTMVTTLARPDLDLAFIAPIYGSMERVTVPANAPPLFGVIASDDPLFAKKGFGLLDAWQEAGKPVEFHLYERGGHGFGLGKDGTTSTGWLDAFVAWLDMHGLLKPS
ncbi:MULTISPECIES: alpha/beta hydrolase [Sphingobium]|uniref:alpha/beta hydrolase n=1 Tax=Sphingobium TaxID=165695 RepID=UPI0015ECBED2|nr:MULTISPECIES: alpha/beta hydrolase [Sphingobium]MCW2362320.1 acetyl esterase/lipase [Sphingobium sp. B10D3B]MCW2401001.1 acetyl esterase/lipase [Sphingobium sp. B10D7B]MCW2407980.1 acetyl esterase/lipase [Sphingobium xanthum]